MDFIERRPHRISQENERHTLSGDGGFHPGDIPRVARNYASRHSEGWTLNSEAKTRKRRYWTAERKISGDFLSERNLSWTLEDDMSPKHVRWEPITLCTKLSCEGTNIAKPQRAPISDSGSWGRCGIPAKRSAFRCSPSPSRTAAHPQVRGGWVSVDPIYPSR